MDEYGELSKRRRLSPKPVILLKAGGCSSRSCQDAWECVCLFQDIPYNIKFTRCLARFKGESNRNLNEDFTISVEDAIYITLSKQDNYCQSRRCTNPEEIVIFLLFVIIDQVGILFGGRFAVIINTDDINIHALRKSCIAENHASRKSCIASQQLCTTRRIHASSKFAHREKILFLAESYASREDSNLAGIYVSREDIHAPQEDIHG